jgi:large subunit ribosomal protein L10
MEKQAIKRKKEEVIRISEKMERAVSFYIVDYSGLDANAMNSLRRLFKKSNFEYFVVKNSILERVGDQLGLEEIPQVLKGPNAISISYEDPVGPAKIINDFYRENKRPEVKLCYIEGEWFLAEDVKKLAELPHREVLIGQMLNVMSSPLSQFVSLLSTVEESFVRVVDAIVETEEKKEDEGTTEEVSKEVQSGEEPSNEVKEEKNDKKGDKGKEKSEGEGKEEESIDKKEETKK